MLSFNLYFIGFMGTGKSTVARYLGDTYHMDVIDMDALIEQREGMSIPEIFRTHGEPYFRDLETALLKELQAYKNKIISCGGGAPLREENVEAMKKNGKVILLTARPDTILERTGNDTSRPLLNDKKTSDQIAELMEQRLDKYMAAAHVSVATDEKSVPDICQEIIEKLWAASKAKARSHTSS